MPYLRVLQWQGGLRAGSCCSAVRASLSLRAPYKGTRKVLNYSRTRHQLPFELKARSPCCSSDRSQGRPESDSTSWGQFTSSFDEEQHHGHFHNSFDGDSRFHRPLRLVLRAAGLLQLAEALQEKLWVSVAISIFFIAAAASGLPIGSTSIAQQVSASCTTAIYILAGIPELVQLLFSLSSGHIDTHVLMTLACFGTLAIGSSLEGALLLVLFQVSHTVEHALTERAQGNLDSLFGRVPDTATLVRLQPDGAPDIAGAQDVPAAQVPVGSHMLVRPGQQVALDGQIVHGEALVSTEHITGESLPMKRGPGEEVPAGALNHDGILVVRAERPASQSTPARIARLTQHAQARKPRLRRWLDSFGEMYARGVIGATAASFLGLLLLGVPLLSQGGRRGALYRALGLLTTASPCALVLVPLAYVSAIAAVTNRGVLIKGGWVLDALVQCSTVALDKTGTLTTGKLSCTGMLPPGALPEASAAHGVVEQRWAERVARRGGEGDVCALALVVALSQRSSHPVSKAAAALAQDASLPRPEIRDFKLVPGAGVQGSTRRGSEERVVRFGSLGFATEGMPSEAAAEVSRSASPLMAENVVSVLVDAPQQPGPSASEPLIRLLTFSDTVHARSAAAIAELQSGAWAGGRGLDFVMLTGDSNASAQRVAKAVGISHTQAGLSPQQKLDAVDSFRKTPAGPPTGRSCGVIMVGDGINDAPALAAADVGVAVAATPSEAAAGAADVLLLTDDGISALPFLLHTAHKTQAVIKQNLVLAVGAMLALSLPVLWGAIPLWMAVALHEGSTLLVALNSLRLLYTRDHSSRPPAPTPTRPDLVASAA